MPPPNGVAEPRAAAAEFRPEGRLPRLPERTMHARRQLQVRPRGSRRAAARGDLDASRCRRERHLPRFPEWTMHARRQLQVRPRGSWRAAARRAGCLPLLRRPPPTNGWRPPDVGPPLGGSPRSSNGFAAAPSGGASGWRPPDVGPPPGRRLRRRLAAESDVRAATIKRRRPERRRKRRAPGDACHRGKPQATTRGPRAAAAMPYMPAMPFVDVSPAQRGDWIAAAGRRRRRHVALQRVAAGRQARGDGRGARHGCEP